MQVTTALFTKEKPTYVSGNPTQNLLVMLIIDLIAEAHMPFEP